MRKQSMAYVVLGGLLIAFGGYFGMMEEDMVQPVVGCENPQIKGNVTQNDKVYHVPDGVYYDQLDVEPENGDKLFCTEADAQAEGFRKSKR